MSENKIINVENNEEENALNNLKSETIAHKDSALQRLDVSFNRHIEEQEYKKSNLLAYWIKDFSNYHDNEKSFRPSNLKNFKRGDIVKVNLGFNVGNELGGLHYCIVLNKNDNIHSGTLNVIPLSSAKKNKEYNSKTCVDLGDELYTSLMSRLKLELSAVRNELEALKGNETTNNIKYISQKVNILDKTEKELSKMKHGSFALIHQITTISKQRIYKTPLLSKIKISNSSLNLIDNKIKELYTK